VSDKAKFFKPVNRLAGALQDGTNRTLREGIRAADRNLTYIAGDCLQHVEEAIARLEQLIADWPADGGSDRLQEFYGISLSIIGVASVVDLPQIDVAAKSLCDVLDGMITRGIEFREPVAVHVGAMRLLRNITNPTDSQHVIDGLLKVRKRFAFDPLVDAKPVGRPA
jgi:hypothetical protein